MLRQETSPRGDEPTGLRDCQLTPFTLEPISMLGEEAPNVLIVRIVIEVRRSSDNEEGPCGRPMAVKTNEHITELPWEVAHIEVGIFTERCHVARQVHEIDLIAWTSHDELGQRLAHPIGINVQLERRRERCLPLAFDEGVLRHGSALYPGGAATKQSVAAF